MSQPAPVKRPATYDDLRRVPEHLVAEILDGELIATPRPSLRHARAASALGIEVGGPFDQGRDGPGGWWILFEPELHFGDDVLVPDVAGWRREHLSVVPDAPFMTQAPDWVCEVISPSTEQIDRLRKMRRYARAAVPHLWIVNPIAHTLEAYRLEAGYWVLNATHGGAETVRVAPFDACELALSHLWTDVEGGVAL